MTISPQELDLLHREFWNRRAVRINALLSKPYLVHIAARRQSESIRFVSMAGSELERIERLKQLRIFECELESADEDLSSSPIYSAQRTRALKLRGKVVEDGRTIDQIIKRLALKPERRNDKAMDLWPHFLAELDHLELEPKECDHPTDPRKSCYEYDFQASRKRISFGRFANVVSNARKKSRLPG